jgi:hypothetical protein
VRFSPSTSSCTVKPSPPELALTEDQLTWNCSLASRSLAALPVTHRAPR